MKRTTFNKEINKFKIAVTSDCCLRCVHCFIDKSENMRIPFEKAKKSLDFFIGSPGEKKILEIYGGEPMLAFDLSAKIIEEARKIAAKRKKQLSVSIASNGLLVEKRHLKYIAANDIRFSVSFSGSSATQDFTRKLPGGQGSYNLLMPKISLILSELGERAHVIFCVHPQQATRMHEDFRELLRIGFRNIGLECVHGFRWRREDYENFSANLEEIVRDVFQMVENNEFILFEPFLEFFREREYPNAFCPFLRDLELYPDGTFAFYPYAFVANMEERRKVSIGSAESGIIDRFNACLPRRDSRRCQKCAAEYYVLPALKEGSIAYSRRTEIAKNAVARILHLSHTHERFRSYLKYLAKLFAEGYT